MKHLVLTNQSQQNCSKKGSSRYKKNDSLEEFHSFDLRSKFPFVISDSFSCQADQAVCLWKEFYQE